jgi:ABC-type transporter Mla subunit MlaD
MPTINGLPKMGRELPPKPRFAWLGLIIVVGLGTLFAWVFLVTYHPPTRLLLRTCFKNALGLKTDAPVRLAGVPVGFVSKVQAKPENRDCAASVEMKLITSYDLKIPRDSIAFIETAGVLGEDFIEIDVAHASGPAIRNGESLQSLEKHRPGLEEILDILKSKSSRPDAPDTSVPRSETNYSNKVKPNDRK